MKNLNDVSSVQCNLNRKLTTKTKHIKKSITQDNTKKDTEPQTTEQHGTEATDNELETPTQ